MMIELPIDHKSNQDQVDSDPVITSYELCPGITFEYTNYTGSSTLAVKARQEFLNSFQISHCLEGSLESQNTEDGLVIEQGREPKSLLGYLRAGQLALNDGHFMCSYYEFPQSIYRGLMIVISPEKFQPITRDIFQQLDLSIDSIKQRYLNQNHVFVASEQNPAGQVLRSLYRPENLFDPKILLIKVLEILRILTAGSKISSDNLNFYDAEVVQIIRSRVRSIMNGQAESDFSLPKLIEETGLATSEFYLVFESIYGRLPGSFLREQALQTAHRLLTDTDLPIKDIASRTGFSSSPKFSTTFKRHFGLSPKAIRNQELRRSES